VDAGLKKGNREMFKRILAPIDGSAHSMKAAEMAIELSRTYDTDLTLLHVTRKLELPDALKDYIKSEHLTRQDLLAIDEATKRVIADIRMNAEARGIKRIKTIFREGKPARTIVAYAKSARIDAIVMGSRGLSELESALLGSVSHKVASLADCTVMIVK
jgi:nucleotide-binding universal stress UspA family protein